MERKEGSSAFGVTIAVASLLGFIVCGVACLTLNQALKTQRRQVTEARAQLSALDQALQNQQRDLNQTKAQLSAAADQIAAAQRQNQTLSQRVAEIQSQPHPTPRPRGNGVTPAQPAPLFQFLPMQPAVPAADVPAANSVEGQLRAQGKQWERAEGQPVVGEYVQDTLPGRMNQPQGRGDIGKVMAVSANDSGTPCATVDFGRGFTAGIMFRELSPIRFVAPDVR